MYPDLLFHPGELTVQQRAGEAQMARMNSGALSNRIPGGAIPFLAQQPMAIAATIAQDGAVWASMLLGVPGFLCSEDGRSMRIDASRPLAAADDPFWENIERGSDLGLLIIELGSRRRLRVNGRATLDAERQLTVEVGAAYPNCPKYIQRRHWSMPAAPASKDPSRASRQGRTLDTRQRAWITLADTLFVASCHPEHGADASHRGGQPGFVEAIDDNTLRIPDYGGNSMFNTLGNFESYPRAGLAFVDFQRGRLLQLTGWPRIRWDLDDPQRRSGGTGRFWDFEVERWRESDLALRLQWEFVDFSPFNPVALGDDASLALQVVEISQEADRVRRFRLRAFDDAELPSFMPGAHLPVALPGDNGATLQRHYSILSDPGERSYYDIAVLHERNSRGGSRYLHESVAPGDQLAALKPKNQFPMARSAQHAVFIAGGIGITPILSMLWQLVRDGGSFELHYTVKRWADLAFRTEIERLAGGRANFYATREPDGSRIQLAAVLGTPVPDTHVYVCGPRKLIVAVREVARAQGWPDEHIHFESFGAEPSSDDHAIRVELARSGGSLVVPADRSILDVLLDAGIAVPYDCKRGECSLCATRYREGQPEHRDLCLTSAEQEQALCVCVSRAKIDGLVLDL
ncbi:MAG: pyridoxamine 5'-phosphate oxidase family protein [Sedimenticolaceae bacterium]